MNVKGTKVSNENTRQKYLKLWERYFGVHLHKRCSLAKMGTLRLLFLALTSIHQ
jgi:hypothetical protein